jgi:hypothetical protein
VVTRHDPMSLTDAVIAALEDVGLLVGDGVSPDSGGWQGTPAESPFIPYVVVHPISGGIHVGTIDDPYVDTNSIYQLSAYGATRAQCERLVGLADAVMMGLRVELEGRRVAHIEHDMEGGAWREDALQPPVWRAVPRYRIHTTPATSTTTS